MIAIVFTGAPSEHEMEIGDVFVQEVATPNETELLEELNCLVGDISLTAVSTDQRQQAEIEDSEQLVDITPKEKEDCDDTAPSEETSSSTDNCFEVQLSKVTHLSLIVRNGLADVLPVEQLPEE
ncbi:hypothetical protein INR49_004407 [Caranx melampygus]|nr:hypothetical protein INR49_004407 [Caranx melampygus]